MKTVRTIAIIGASGKTGSAIARALAMNRYRLLLIEDDERTKVSTLKSDLENQNIAAELYTMECEREASWEADIVIVATPSGSQKRVAEKIRDVATGKVVITAFTAEAPINYREVSRSAAEELQLLLPYSKVVMTVNSAFAGNANTPELFIAGNTGDAVDAVAELAAAAGFQPVIVGDLTAARTLEKTCSNQRWPGALTI